MVQELSDRMRTGRVRLTHAYFGRMSARQSLTMATVHTRHHARQLAAVTAAYAPSAPFSYGLDQ